MDNPYSDTKSNLKEWLKVSFKHFKDLKEAFTRETKGLIDEARKEYEKSKEEPVSDESSEEEEA